MGLLLLLLPLPPLTLSYLFLCKNTRNYGVELGVVFVWIVFLYSWAPLLGIALANAGYGEIKEYRFTSNGLVFSENAVTVGFYYMAFLVGFSVLYFLIRKLGRTSSEFIRPAGYQIGAIIFTLMVLLLVRIILTNILGAGESVDYIASYTVYWSHSLIVQQVMGVLSHLELVMVIALMVYIMMWRPHLHRHIAMIIVLLLLYSILSGGSRALGFLSAFSYVVCYSICVKKLKNSHLAVLGILGVMFFLMAGMLRSGVGDGLAPLQGGEFISHFINSLDLMRLVNESNEVFFGWKTYFSDIARLIPQQLLWFEKFDPAVWYVSTYYSDYYEMGGGLAFGAVAESVIGFGAAEAFLRGGLLGVSLACTANYCFSGRVDALKVISYVWFVVVCYQSVRDTTFSVFPRFFFHVLPLIITLMFVNKIWLTIKRSSYRNLNEKSV